MILASLARGAVGSLAARRLSRILFDFHILLAVFAEIVRKTGKYYARV